MPDRNGSYELESNQTNFYGVFDAEAVDVCKKIKKCENNSGETPNGVSGTINTSNVTNKNMLAHGEKRPADDILENERK